jgi:phosphohistidine phosphatase SixA
MDAPRRQLLLQGASAAVACCGSSLVSAESGAGVDPQAHLAARLRSGGVVIAFRHALAPGTFDPPGFVLDSCPTQRNLNDEGRSQAERIGAWFRSQGLTPAQVRSSPWCRCLDTARLAFGAAAVTPWAALGSPAGTAEQAYPDYQAVLRKAAAQRRAMGGFEVWVTHLFVLQDLVGQSVASAEALVLQGDPRAPDSRSAVQVLGHWRLPTG